LDASKLPPKQFQISNTLQKKEGGSTNMGKGTKHLKSMKQQGAKRYLGGQGSNETHRSRKTLHNNET
jgi:hypothetical protein